MKFFILFIAAHHLLSIGICAEELACTINGKKSLNIVSDKFLSLSLDPAMLFFGLGLGTPTKQLVKYLNPAYIRIAGPSTGYLRFTQEESILNSKDTILNFTPTMWKSLNSYFSNTNLLPIFTISDDSDEKKLNSKTIFPLLEFSDGMNLNCSWQLDDEISRRSMIKYKEEFISFKYLLNMFANSKEAWRIIGPDISHWLKEDPSDNDLDDLIDTFANLTEVLMWTRSNDYISKPLISNKKAIWLISEKSQHPITFKSTISWAKTIGEGASSGYEAVFREPRLFEMIAETPIFWLMLFHKKLMGRTVLEAKPNRLDNTSLSIYCHCTRNQNDFLRRGALTVFAVNEENIERSFAIKISTITSKNVEIRSYVLTANFDNSTSTFLNGVHLNLNILNNNTLPKPTLRRARNQKGLALDLPSNSIGFFVIPDARAPACINNEEDTDSIMHEIQQDQDTDFLQQYSRPEINSRIKESITSLKELYFMMERELEDDERYYDIISEDGPRQSETLKSALKLPEINNAIPSKKAVIPQKSDSSKRNNDIEKKKVALKQKITEKTRLAKNKFKTNSTNEEFVTSTEKYNVTSILVKKAGDIRNRKVREAKGGARGRAGGHGNRRGGKKTNPAWKKVNKKSKRDINMELLEQKTKEIETKGNRKRLSKKRDFNPIVQPKYLYEDQDEDIEDEEEKARNKNDSKSTIKKLAEGIKRKEISGDFDSEMDYLDILDEVGSPNSRYFPDDSSQFPVKPTFRIGDPYNSKKDEDWLNKEIVIDNAEDIDEAIKQLESYLNREKSDEECMEDLDFSLPDYYDDIEYADANTPMRYKRDEGREYTEEDIRYYKMLMNSNIRHMRESIRKQKLKVTPLKMRNQKSGEFESETIPPSPEQRYSSGYPRRVSIKSNLDEAKARNSIRILKNRLAQHRLATDNNSKSSRIYAPRKAEEIDEETKRLIRRIKSELRNRRIRSIRSKRYIDEDGNSLDNDLNSLANDANYLIPKLDDTQISLILPSKDEITFTNSESEAEITFKLRKVDREELTTDSSSLEDTTETNSDRINNSTITMIRNQNYSHIQKIGGKGGTNPLDRFFKSVTDFVDDIHDRIKSYLTFI